MRQSIAQEDEDMDNYVQQASPEPEAAQPPKIKRKRSPLEDAVPKQPKVQENRAIYVTNLPLDATVEEIDQEFSKYGMIDVGLDNHKRIKMYEDDMGEFKGEALIIYFKKESVGLAIRMMDDSWFRPGKGPNIRVKEADATYKRVQGTGEDVKKKLARKDRKANEAQRAEMHRRLADWSDDDPDMIKQAYAPRTNKWAKYVIVKHAFTFEELEKDPDALTEIKLDMRDQAEEFGAITKIVLYDAEPEGIVAIRFKDPEHAIQFKERCHNRWFDQRQLKVEIATDRPKFQKSSKADDSEEEEDDWYDQHERAAEV